jgi:hypothetical protein
VYLLNDNLPQIIQNNLYGEIYEEDAEEQHKKDEDDFNQVKFDSSEIHKGEYFEKTNEEVEALNMLTDPKKKWRLNHGQKLELIDKIGKQMLDDEEKLFRQALEEQEQEQNEKEEKAKEPKTKIIEAGNLHDEFLPFERISGANRREYRSMGRHWPDENPPRDRVENSWEDLKLQEFKDQLRNDRYMHDSVKQQEKELGQLIEKNIYRLREGSVFKRIRKVMSTREMNMVSGNEIRVKAQIIAELYGNQYAKNHRRFAKRDLSLRKLEDRVHGEEFKNVAVRRNQQHDGSSSSTEDPQQRHIREVEAELRRDKRRNRQQNHFSNIMDDLKKDHDVVSKPRHVRHQG